MDWMGREGLPWRPGLILARKRRQILSGKLIEEKEGPWSESLIWVGEAGHFLWAWS